MTSRLLATADTTSTATTESATVSDTSTDTNTGASLVQSAVTAVQDVFTALFSPNGTTSVPTSLIALAQSVTAAVATTKTESADSYEIAPGITITWPTLVLPPSGFDPDSPAWEAQWEAFSTSIVAWVPGVSTVINYLSLGIDTYEFVRAVEARSTTEVADEVGDLSGDLANLYLFEGSGSTVRVLVLTYAATPIAVYIIDAVDALSPATVTAA